MKITKQRLKEMIKEELGSLGEGAEADAAAFKALKSAAADLGQGEEFVAAIDQALLSAVGTHGGAAAEARLKMSRALAMLLPQAMK